ncbi:MAG: DUF1638 domain-containing protein, partial [bacterium]|nr:DUF1638 domain-containing protein [bacterium]
MSRSSSRGILGASPVAQPNRKGGRVYLKVIACEVAFREISYCAARSTNLVDMEFLSQGYHDNPEVGVHRIQERIDAVEPGRFEGILLGYGLCNHMLTGLRAAHTQLIIPRAHDCITFFLGSKERYTDFFMGHSGAYYFTTGWLEHRDRGGERPDRKQGAGLGVQLNYEELLEKYGEENARYLIETMGNWTNHYSKGVFIDFEFSKHLPAKQWAREICEDRGWDFEVVQGDLGLFQRWFDGPWPEKDFLVVPPGETIQPSYDE